CSKVAYRYSLYW
nr:immunoglobulin heavy chain junction region [Macaca mulatta]MOY25702.1 immunoglobulin heavy chain junction region [Macaca mulatta]MOY27370.1 immunoglobulin heavy chain junction region [Macaca mulatta]